LKKTLEQSNETWQKKSKEFEKKILDLTLQLEMKDSTCKTIEEELVKERESSKLKMEDTTQMLTRYN
jgi:hypothetical protein